MPLIGAWYSTTLDKDTDNQNTPEVNLQDSFEAIEIDIPVLSAEAEVQIKGSNASGGTFDLVGLEEPIPSSAGAFRTTVPLGGKYRYIKVYLSAVQTANRVFAVRGISYASGGLVAMLDRIKAIETAVLAISSPPTAVIGAIQSGVGNVYVGAAKLYWIHLANGYMSNGWVFIKDGTSGTGGFKIWIDNEVSYMFLANPPMQFNTGIRCSEVSNYAKDMVFGYLPD